jgi:hypothetical protein
MPHTELARALVPDCRPHFPMPDLRLDLMLAAPRTDERSFPGLVLMTNIARAHCCRLRSQGMLWRNVAVLYGISLTSSYETSAEFGT